MRRLKALVRKESYQIVRDPSSVIIAFILPVVMLFIYGFGVNLDSTQVRLGLVMEDTGAEAQRLAAGFTGSQYYNTRIGSRPEMEQALVDGKIRGMVVIPQDFSEKLLHLHDVAPIQLITDASEPNMANFVRNYVEATWQVWLQQRATANGQVFKPPITIDARFWFNPSAESRNYIIPGSITLIMIVIGALLTSLVVAREWERGTMEGLLATPITRTEFLLSKLIPYYVLNMISLSLCVGVTVFLLGVPFRGSFLVLLVIATFFSLTALGIGLFFSTLTRNQFLAAQLALNAAFLPALMLSGFLFEIASMPLPLRILTRLLPPRYFVDAVQTLFQAGNIYALLWKDLSFLMLSAAFFIGMTARKTHRHLEK